MSSIVIAWLEQCEMSFALTLLVADMDMTNYLLGPWDVKKLTKLTTHGFSLLKELKDYSIN